MLAQATRCIGELRQLSFDTPGALLDSVDDARPERLGQWALGAANLGGWKHLANTSRNFNELYRPGG